MPIISEIKIKLIAKPFKLPFSSDIFPKSFQKNLLKKILIPFKSPMMQFSFAWSIVPSK